MLKDFIFRKMAESQLKNVPEEFKQKLINLFLNNPEFMRTIGEEIKKEMDLGKEQFEAVKVVLERHKEEAEDILKDGGII